MDWKLWIAKVAPSFWPEIQTSGRVSDDEAGRELGNSDFQVLIKPIMMPQFVLPPVFLFGLPGKTRHTLPLIGDNEPPLCVLPFSWFAEDTGEID